jgi:hypothetical protein
MGRRLVVEEGALELAVGAVHDLIDADVLDGSVLEQFDAAVPGILFHQRGVLLARRDDVIGQPFIPDLGLREVRTQERQRDC